MFFGVTRRTVCDWLDAGAPHKKRRYPLDEIAQWLRARTENTERPTDETGQALQRRRDEADTNRAEQQFRRLWLGNEQTAGQLLERDEVQRAIAAKMVRLRTSLLALAGRIATVVPSEQRALTKQLVSETVRTALREVTETPALKDESINKLIQKEAKRIAREGKIST